MSEQRVGKDSILCGGVAIHTARLLFVAMVCGCGGQSVTTGDGASDGAVADVPTRVDVPNVDIPAMPQGRGAPCTVDAECERGLLCAAGPDVTHICTVPCTSDRDCAPENRCLIDRAPNGVRALCSLTEPGTNESGSVCANNNDCASNLCVAQHCRALCMDDANCTMPSHCQPTPEANMIRSCQFEPVAAPRVDETVLYTGNIVVDRPPQNAFELAPDTVSFNLWVQDLEGRNLFASVARLTAPDGATLIDSSSWTIVRDQPVREIIPIYQINSVLVPSSDTLMVQSGRYTYNAGFFNDPDAMTGIRNRRGSIVLRTKRAPGGMIPNNGSLHLRLFFAPGIAVNAARAPADARLQAGLTAMRDAYRAIGIAVDVAGYMDLTAADAARFTLIDSRDELDALFEQRMAGRADEVNLYFVQSIAAAAGLANAIGVAGDIVGPIGVQGTRHSGVCISWNDTLNGGGRNDLLSNVFAHEVGHYMGLWHTQENLPPCRAANQMDCSPFGGVDPISDTATGAGARNNVMFWVASPNQVTFTGGQGRVVRASTLITP